MVQRKLPYIWDTLILLKKKPITPHMCIFMVLKDRISINSRNFWVKHYVLFCVLILFHNLKMYLVHFLKIL